MAAAASSSVIIFDGSMVVGGADSVPFGTGLLVAGSLGLGRAFDLGAAGCGTEFGTAAWRNGWRPMTIPAAIPSSPSNVASKIPFAFTQTLILVQRAAAPGQGGSGSRASRAFPGRSAARANLPASSKARFVAATE